MSHNTVSVFQSLVKQGIAQLWEESKTKKSTRGGLNLDDGPYYIKIIGAGLDTNKNNDPYQFIKVVFICDGKGNQEGVAGVTHMLLDNLCAQEEVIENGKVKTKARTLKEATDNCVFRFQEFSIDTKEVTFDQLPELYEYLVDQGLVYKANVASGKTGGKFLNIKEMVEPDALKKNFDIDTSQIAVDVEEAADGVSAAEEEARSQAAAAAAEEEAAKAKAATAQKQSPFRKK